MREHPDDVRCGLYGQLRSGVTLYGPRGRTVVSAVSHSSDRGVSPLFSLLFTGNYQRKTATSPQKSLGLARLRQKKTANISGLLLLIEDCELAIMCASEECAHHGPRARGHKYLLSPNLSTDK
jgi:hypothetical protein